MSAVMCDRNEALTSGMLLLIAESDTVVSDRIKKVRSTEILVEKI